MFADAHKEDDLHTVRISTLSSSCVSSFTHARTWGLTVGAPRALACLTCQKIWGGFKPPRPPFERNSRNEVQMWLRSSLRRQPSPHLRSQRPGPTRLSTTPSARWCRQSPACPLSVAISRKHRRRRSANRER